jgi:hypothetical protein
MSWSRKQKTPTKEVLIEQAKKALEKFWFGSEALLTGIKAGEKWIPFPLSQKFTSGTWILLLEDPTEFASENVLKHLHEWHRRYASFEIGFIHLYCPPYPTMQLPEVVEQLVKRNQLPFISALDFEQSLAKAFSATHLPMILGFHQGKLLFQNSGGTELWRIETRLQEFLRQSDPGLPLLPVLKSTTSQKKNCERIEFADSTSDSMKEVQIAGTWTRLADRIVTTDPHATISFNHNATHFSLVARSANPKSNPAEVAVEINGNLPFETMLGKDLALREDGLATLEIRENRLYEALVKMPTQTKQFKLHFPRAAKYPVELFGLRFGECVTSNPNTKPS